MNDYVDLPLTLDQAGWLVDSLNALEDNVDSTRLLWRTRVLITLKEAKLAAPVFDRNGMHTGSIQALDAPQIRTLANLYGLKFPDEAYVRFSRYDCTKLLEFLGDAMYTYIRQGNAPFQKIVQDILFTFVEYRAAIPSVDVVTGFTDMTHVWTMDSPAMRWVRNNLPKPEDQTDEDQKEPNDKPRIYYVTDVTLT